jgi:hypothetical protein
MSMYCPGPESGPGVNKDMVVVQLRKGSLWRWKCRCGWRRKQSGGQTRGSKEVAGDALAVRIIRLRFSVHRDITRLLD